ncbi:hypothetical protein CEP54_013126 [Fusarium duplospermum]|uniref:Uncharacterized protein n=1 Tax=Fusarium duplospermum TaxID=1325734 RepID=A0A428P4T1_9HYPO|nr:hypothetical protein CEP54_013126 [Fusarium duplospermum]
MDDQHRSSPTAPNNSPGPPGDGALPSQEAALILDRIKTYQRAPTALPAWLEHVKQGQHGSAARTFYEEGGFAAWFGYSLVKHAADHQTNFAGKAACKHLISRLDDSTADYQRRLAAEVIEHLPGRDERRIKALQRKLQMGQTQKTPPRQNRNKRQRTCLPGYLG